VEEVDAVRDSVLDDHPLGISTDELGRRSAELVGDQQGGLLMAQVGDRQLSKRPIVVLERDPLIEDARRSVLPRDVVEFDPAPCGERNLMDCMEHLRRASSQRDEVDVHLIQLVEIGVCGQLGVEDQLLRQVARSLLPEFHEPQDLVALLVLSDLSMGVAEDSDVGVLRDEGEHALLTTTPLRDVVLLDESVVSVIWNRVEVEIEGDPPLETQLAHGVEPPLHEWGIAGRANSAAVLGKKGALGDRVQAGKESQPLVEHRAHDVAVTRVSEQLQSQQGTHRLSGGNELGPREPSLVEQRIEPRRNEAGEEEEQSAEPRAKGPGGEVELSHIRLRSGLGSGPGGSLLVAPARQPRKALLLQDQRDGRRAQARPLGFERAADVVDRLVLLAQRDDLVADLIALGSGLGRWATSADGSPSTKYARRASYWRWVVFWGTRKA